MKVADILAWVRNNPVFFTLVVWPIITGIVTSIFRKPTAEEYAQMSPRWAAFRRFIAAIGLDIPKTLETVRLFLTNSPPPPPRGPAAGPYRDGSPPPAEPPADDNAANKRALRNFRVRYPWTAVDWIMRTSVMALSTSIAAAALIFLLVRCGGGEPKPIVPPNANGADCLAERVKRQLTCVQTYKTDSEIDACKAGVRAAIDCTTEAGVEAYVTTTRDAGKE